MVAMATPVNKKEEMKAGRSPKFSMPMARAPRMTVKLSQERKVRSLAKKTLGSTRVGSAMRLPVGEGVREEGLWLGSGVGKKTNPAWSEAEVGWTS
jgi:hypothetical protein